MAGLLESISPARLFDESLKLLQGGSAEKSFGLLARFQAGRYLFPATLACLDSRPDEPASQLVTLALRNTDRRLADGKSVTPAFMYAALLWPPLLDRLHREGNAVPTPAQIQQAASEVIHEQLQYTAIPRRFSAMMREIWELQWRMQPHNRRRVLSLFQHPRFRAAYDFLLLREEAGEATGGLGQWWTEFQEGDSTQQEKMIQAIQARRPPRKRRRRQTGQAE